MNEENWINLVLDLKLALKNTPINTPHFAAYLWGIESDNNNEYQTGFEYDGNDIGCILSAFGNLFKHDPSMVPIICSAAKSYIMSLPSDKQKEINKVINKIFNYE